MKLLAIGESLEHVCTRYRITPFRRAFAHAGFTLDFSPLPQTVFGWLKLLQQAEHADAVILQRCLIPFPWLSLLRQKSKYFIFDFDDAIWLRDSYSHKGSHSAKRLRRFRNTCKMADHVVAGNSFLAEAASKTAGRVFVSVIPTCVDVSQYTPRQTRPPGPLTFVWVGSSSTMQGLNQAKEHLEALAKAVPEAVLKLICDKPMSLEHLKVDFVPWNAATETREIAKADVGIAWMPDDDWSRGKCGLKVLQYQAAGLATLANPVGVHKEFIIPNKTGILANSVEEWGKAAAYFNSIANGSGTLMLEARAFVERTASTQVGGSLWAQVLSHAAPVLTRKAG